MKRQTMMCLILILVNERTLIMNKKGIFYFMSISEIEHNELIEEVTVTKSENLLINYLNPSKSVDSYGYSDSIISSLNLKDACFALEKVPIKTKSRPTLANSDSNSSSSLSGDSLSDR